MIENEEASSREAPPVRTSLYAARQAAGLAAAAVDEATDAVCRASSGSAPRLEEVMHAAHKEAGDAERYAAWAEGWESEGVSERVLAKYASMAVGAALRAQVAAGVETSASALQLLLARPLTVAERAERESAVRKEEAREEEAARAATGMDRENRELEDANRFFAEMSVAELGWTAGHVRVLEAGASGRLYWRGGQARQGSRAGVREGGRRVSRERTKALYAARFLTGTRHDDGARVLTLTPMGQIALRLAQLHPAGLYPDDRAAYEARYAAAARRWMSSDEKKAAAARLVPLERAALRAYRRPVTLAEQEERARIEEADRWEDEGGSCPGVEAPRPRPEREVAVGPEVEATPPGSTRRSVPEGRVGPRMPSAPRTDLEAPAHGGAQPARLLRPVAAAAGRRARSAPRGDRMQLALF
ncbi:hypothetical protein ACFCZ5_34830 [Streptomyces microflavus]|uniref:hypothetical protein n=1 Tax=Streptomyces microflavus TaxID=1919 RepID=UPI0035D8204C